MEKLVSIVLPVYNGEKYLRESIDSVLNQTYQNWELILVDDCSLDSTPSIAKEYVERDSRVRYYRNSENLRLPRNLNRGFSLTKGEYLTWTSDDNRYLPTAISVMVDALENSNNAEFVFASCHIIDSGGEITEKFSVTKKSPQYIVGSNVVGACFLYTRNVYTTVGEYDPEYTLVEDFDYWQRICSKFKAIGVEEILYEYRQHEGNLTNTMKKDEFNRALEKMLLKNGPLYGKMNFVQKFYYYQTLNRSTQSNNKEYRKKYMYYKLLYFWGVRIPGRLRRMSVRNTR